MYLRSIDIASVALLLGLENLQSLIHTGKVRVREFERLEILSQVSRQLCRTLQDYTYVNNGREVPGIYLTTTKLQTGRPITFVCQSSRTLYNMYMYMYTLERD